MEKIIKTYLSSIISVVCIFIRFTPWLIVSNEATVKLYLISDFWFVVAFVLLIIKVVFAIRNRKKNDRVQNRHEIISILIIVACFVILEIALLNGIIIIL